MLVGGRCRADFGFCIEFAGLFCFDFLFGVCKGSGPMAESWRVLRYRAHCKRVVVVGRTYIIY